MGGKGLNKQPRDLKHIKISITETLLGFVKLGLASFRPKSYFQGKFVLNLDCS